MAQDDKSFLERWARRKQRLREHKEEAPGDQPEPVESAARGQAVEAPAGEVSPSSAKTIDPKDLPDIDSLTADSDFTAFLQEGVPEALRRQALRRLWRSNPVLANLDGLIDYGEDYSDAATVIEGLRTAYKVGRGIFGDEGEAKEEKEERAKPEVSKAERKLDPEPKEPQQESLLEPQVGENSADSQDSTSAARDDGAKEPLNTESGRQQEPAKPVEQAVRGRALARRWGGKREG